MSNTPRDARPPSIYDVARLAGVSYQTVSRVINASPLVSEKSKKIVLAAIAELDFHPSSAARAFSTGRGTDIAVIMSEVESYGWSATLAGIQQGARKRNRSIVLHDLRDARQALSWMKSQTVHATLVLGGSDASREFVAGFPAGHRLIGVGDREIDGHDWLSFDEYDGALQGVRHLQRLGHRRIAFVTVPSLRGTWREEAFRAALGESGSPVRVEEIPASEEAAFSRGADLAATTGVTAVFCANDQIALPVLAGIRASGRSVPGDISVIGFDDHPLSAYAFPALTTVRQDFHELGRLAIDLIEDGTPSDEPRQRRLPAPLVARATTGRAG